MSQARQKIDAVVAAVLSGRKPRIDLDELQECLEELESEEGVLWNTGHGPDWVYSDLEIPDWDDEALMWIWDNLDESRQQQFNAGAEPTTAEIQMWREAYIERFFRDPKWDGGYVVRTIKDSKGREIAALLNTSGGGWDYGESIDGLFRTSEEAYAAMDANEHTILEPF